MSNNILSQYFNENNFFFKYLNEINEQIKYLVHTKSDLPYLLNLLFTEYHKLYLSFKDSYNKNLKLENEIINLKNEIDILKNNINLNKNKDTVPTKPPGLESTNNNNNNNDYYSLFNNHFNPCESINDIIKNNVSNETDSNKEIKNDINIKKDEDFNNRFNMILNTDIKTIHRLLKKVMFIFKSKNRNIVFDEKYTIFFKDTFYGPLFFDVLKNNNFSYSLFIRMSDDPKLKYVRKFNIYEKKYNMFHISDP